MRNKTVSNIDQFCVLLTHPFFDLTSQNFISEQGIYCKLYVVNIRNNLPH